MNKLALLLSSALIATASAQFTPLKCGSSTDDVSACYFKDNYCNFFEGFDAPLQAISIDRYNGDPNSADWVLESGHPTVNNGILTMPLINNGAGNVAGSAILSSTHFLNYGSFEVRMKTVGQSSAISTWISISNVQDEIDWEFLPKAQPGQENQAQTNWFYHGVKLFGVNGGNFNAASNTYDNWHTYKTTISPSSITWEIDGTVVRTLNSAGLNNYPGNTPPRIQFGVWHDVESPGWAGANTLDFSQNTAVQIDWISIKAAECQNQPTGTQSFSVLYPKNITNVPTINKPSNGGSTSSGTTSNGGSSGSGSDGSSSGSSGSSDGNSFGDSGSSKQKSTSSAVIGATFNFLTTSLAFVAGALFM